MTEPVSLSRRIARTVRAQEFPATAVAKVKIAFFDYLSSAFESLNLPPSLQAIKIASRWQGGAITVIGTPIAVSASEAAFVNAILGHGLVREDMHTASVSHLGTVVFPALLALSQSKPIRGRDFVSASVAGYEVGGAIGRAVMDAETVRVFRPTGITGTIGAAAAGARLLSLDEDATVTALGLAANTTVGLNEWPKTGADEMFFHVGYAARNAVTAVELAELGARASETALDGQAGLFTAIRRADRVDRVRPFERDTLELMEVFHKPAGACNYAQTAIQAASQLGVEGRDVASIRVRCTAAAINYPGCNAPGPFGSILQAKMSIHHGVASALAKGDVAEIARLATATTLEEDADLTAAYPGAQGSEVIATLRDGREVRKRLRDLTPASEADVRARYERAASQVLGRAQTDVVASMIDTLEVQEEVGVLGALLAAR